jgi:hypothetical protein
MGFHMSIDTELTLDMLHVQLRWLERELVILRRLFDEIKTPPAAAESFEKLGGVWQGIVFTDEDFDSSHLAIPEGI